MKEVNVEAENKTNFRKEIHPDYKATRRIKRGECFVHIIHKEALNRSEQKIVYSKILLLDKEGDVLRYVELAQTQTRIDDYSIDEAIEVSKAFAKVNGYKIKQAIMHIGGTDNANSVRFDVDTKTNRAYEQFWNSDSGKWERVRQ